MRFLIAGVLLSMSVAEASLLHDRIGHNYMNAGLITTTQKVFGSACYSMKLEAESPTCSASSLSETNNTETFFGINGSTAYDSGVYSEARSLIHGADKIKIAQNLLAQQQERRFEADTQIWWRGPTWALVLQPARWTYFSAVRNSAYPELHIHAMQEQSISYSVGGLLGSKEKDEGWRLGLQTRYLKRQLVQEQFNLFEAIPNIDNYFIVHTQNQLLLEPSVSYYFDHSEPSDLGPLLTIHLMNVGFTDKKREETPLTPALQTGVSVSPELGDGTLELSMNYSWDDQLWQDRRLRLGSQYLLDQVVLSAGWDPRELALGISTKNSPIKGGLSWKNTQYPDDLGGVITERAWQVELGLLF